VNKEPNETDQAKRTAVLDKITALLAKTEHPKRPKPNVRTARKSFMLGMIARLSQRLFQMKRAQGQSSTNNCREILLAKTQIVEAAYNDSYKPRKNRTIFKLKGKHPQVPLRDETAFDAGVAAGDRASISSGALPS
jgi:hypothetical protein